MNIIFIDLANLHKEVSSFYKDFSYVRLYNYLKVKYKADKVILFTGFLETKQSLYTEMKTVGYEYVFKDVILNLNNNKIKANCDSDLCVSGVRNFYENDLKRAILISADGDFSVLIRFWLEKKIEVKIISPAAQDRCSILLKRTNVPITFLNQIIHKLKS